MPIGFFYIPPFLQARVVEKMDMADFVNFEKSTIGASAVIDSIRTHVIAKSKSAYWFELEENAVTVCKRFRLNFEPLYWIRSKIRLHQIEVHLKSALTEEFALALLNLFHATQSSANAIIGRCSLEPDSLENFLNFFQGLEEINLSNLSVDHLRIPAMKTILDISAPLEDEDFFALKATRMVCIHTKITCRGLNFYIKEGIKGTRSIVAVHVIMGEELDKSILFEGLCEDVTRDSFCIRTDDRRVIRVGIRTLAPPEKVIHIVTI